MVKVFLLEDVKGLGQKGSIINVSDGHAHNLLLPKGQAKLAGKSEQVIASSKQARIAEKLSKNKVNTDKITHLIKTDAPLLTLKKAAGKDHLFAAIHEAAIADAIKETFGIDIDPKKQIIIKEPLKTLGIHEISLKLNNTVMKAKIEIMSE